MVASKPKLLYAADVRRNKYFRRFMWLLLAVVAAGAAWIALDEVAGREAADPDVLQIGKVIAVGVIVLLSVRGLVNLWHFFTTRNDSVRIFDRGFVWKRGKKQYKYGWNDLKAFRDSARTRRLFGRPIYHTGAQTFVMRDGNAFKINWKHGDPERVAKAISAYLADAIGTTMGRALRQNKTVRLHKALAMTHQGVIAGDDKISWSKVDVHVKGNRLTILRANSDGNFKPVKRYDTRKIDNLAGFLDVADGAMRNHQHQRYSVQARRMSS